MSTPKLLCVEKKIKDLQYTSYEMLIAVSVKNLEHALGSNNEALLEEMNGSEQMGKLFIPEDAKPKSLWFKGEREFLKFLCRAGYVTEKEIFIKCL